MSVLLVSAPFGALERPASGLSLIEAGLARKGIHCQAAYLTFWFAEMIGTAEYRWLSDEVPFAASAGDWTFTSALFGSDPARDRAYVEEVLVGRCGFGKRDVDRVLRIRARVEPFLEYALGAISWRSYKVVSFMSACGQNIASLALARRIKARAPHATIVFGGANWEGEMGVAQHRVFSFVDYALSSRADESFPDLARHLLDWSSISAPPAIAGLIRRDAVQGRGSAHEGGGT